MNVIPAILPKTFSELEQLLSRVEGLASFVQIDLCDGVFGLQKTWLPVEGELLPPSFSYEFDIMVTDWKKYMNIAIGLGATRVVLHADTFSLATDIKDAVELAKEKNIKLGIAVSNDVPIDKHVELIEEISKLYSNIYIQVMGIRNIGAQGQPFDEDVLIRIKKLKETFLDISIQVDGSMNDETARRVKEAGSDTVVVGSYLFKQDDIQLALQTLQNV